MAARALDFCTANPSDQASIKTTVARLEALVNRAEQLAVQQRSGKVDEALARSQRGAIRDTVRRDQLRQLVRIAIAAKKEHPELKELFRLPAYGATNHDFLVGAQDMLVKAIAQKPLLDTLGLGETFIDDLTKGVAAYQAATEGGHAARRSRVGASAEVISAVEEAVKVVGVLDGLNRPRFKDDPELLAAWISASEIPASFKKATTAAPVTPPPVAEGGSKATA